MKKLLASVKGSESEVRFVAGICKPDMGNDEIIGYEPATIHYKSGKKIRLDLFSSSSVDNMKDMVQSLENFKL